MKQKIFRSALVAAALAASAAGAQAQLALSCPAGATAGTPATPLTVYTGAGGTWDVRYGTGGTWGTTYGTQHPNWYTPAAGQGTWLMPSPYPTPVSIPTTDPFFYRSPTITVSPQIDLSSIQMSVRQSADNFYVATGLVNASNPETYVNYGGVNGFGTLSSAFSVNTLPWVAGANQLIVRGQNAEASYDPPTTSPTGVYAIFDITATCTAPIPPQAVPVNNPWALLAVAAGLAGFGAQRLRRRK